MIKVNKLQFHGLWVLFLLVQTVNLFVDIPSDAMQEFYLWLLCMVNLLSMTTETK